MKSLFKVTLLATTMAVALHTPVTLAAEATRPVTAADSRAVLKSDDQKSAYALGASLGCCMENFFREQEKLGIKLDKDQLITGVQDTLADKSRLPDREVEQILQAFEARVKSSAQAKMEKDTADSETRGKECREKFAKEKGVRISSTGLVYQVVGAGKGETLKNSDTIVVDYRGTLIDNKGFDDSHTYGGLLSFRLDGVISGWTESLKDIEKGGKIKLVIPPELAYGKAGVPEIPPNSALVLDVELLDAKPAPKADAKLETDTKAADSTKE